MISHSTDLSSTFFFTTRLIKPSSRSTLVPGTSFSVSLCSTLYSVSPNTLSVAP